MVTLKDLEKASELDTDIVLYCVRCHSEYSASPGDYWHMSDSHAFKCCGSPMRLARKEVQYVELNYRKGDDHGE